MGLIPVLLAKLNRAGSLHGENLFEKKIEEINEIRGNQIAMTFKMMTSLNPIHTCKQIMESVLIHTEKSKQEAYDRALYLMNIVGIPNAEKG